MVGLRWELCMLYKNNGNYNYVIYDDFGLAFTCRRDGSLMFLFAMGIEHDLHQSGEVILDNKLFH